MNRDAWRDFPGAPAPGTALCDAADIPAQGVKSLDIQGFPVLLLRGAEGLRAYVNACPHQFLPLDWRSDRILSPDGRVLRCSNHDAGFDADTGQGLDGVAQGCALDPVPVELRDGALVIAGAPDA